jgi:hypothetical protein
MKGLVLAMLALPGVAAAQMNESAARRVIDTQLATGVTNPPGPGVPGSEAPRLLGRAPDPRLGAPAGSALPGSLGGAPAGGGNPFGSPGGTTPGR